MITICKPEGEELSCRSQQPSVTRCTTVCDFGAPLPPPPGGGGDPGPGSGGGGGGGGTTCTPDYYTYSWDGQTLTATKHEGTC